MNTEIETKHESYGALEITRSHRSPTALFGSSIMHEHVIRLRISSAKLQRTHNRDTIYPSNARKDCYVDVEMSYSQFAEAITSLNQGSGTPVTVRYANGKEMTPCPYIRKDEQFRAEFETDLEELAKVINSGVKRAEALFASKKPLTKAEKEELLSIFGRLSMAVSSNIPFVRDSFVEQMDRVVTESKGNIEGFFQSKMESLANATVADIIAKNGAETLLGLADKAH